MYKVLVNRPNGMSDWPWASTYFPRSVRYLKDAKTLAKSAVEHGATMVRIEYPNGAELDFRPKIRKSSSPGDCYEVGGVI